MNLLDRHGRLTAEALKAGYVEAHVSPAYRNSTELTWDSEKSLYTLCVSGPDEYVEHDYSSLDLARRDRQRIANGLVPCYQTKREV